MDQSLISLDIRERKDIVRPDRLQGFSDSVFATAATMLIVPIRRFEPGKEENLRDALLQDWPKLFVFIFGFLVICAVWESHNMRFKLIKRIDDAIVGLTLISLMATTFLPFTVALEGHYGSFAISMVLNCVVLLFLELIELILFVYAFHSPKLLHPQFQLLDEVEMQNQKRLIYLKIGLNCSLFVISYLISLASSVASGILVCAVIITPLLRRIMVKWSNWCPCIRSTAKGSNFNAMTGRIEKERIKCFSDAAIATVATLLILDLTIEDFPKKVNVGKYGLNEELVKMWQQFVGYMGSYTVIGFLWFVHHSVLHHIKVFTPFMVILNNIFLAFLAGTPFISTLINRCIGKLSHNEQIAVRFSCVVTFMASFMHVCIFLLAKWNKETSLHHWAIPSNNLGVTSATQLYLLLKTLIIPLVTVLTFIASLFSPYSTSVAYHIALFLVPILFIILKIVYACHSCRRSTNNTDFDSTERTLSSTDAVILTLSSQDDIESSSKNTVMPIEYEK